MPNPCDRLVDAVLPSFLGRVDFKVGTPPLLCQVLGQLSLDPHLRLCILVEGCWREVSFFNFWDC